MYTCLCTNFPSGTPDHDSMIAPMHVNTSWSDFPCSFAQPDWDIYLESVQLQQMCLASI